MLRSLMVPVVVLGFSACMVGPSTRTFAPANGPDGIEADLRLKGARVRGELLEVQDSALLVLRADRYSQVAVPVDTGTVLLGLLKRGDRWLVDGVDWDRR